MADAGSPRNQAQDEQETGHTSNRPPNSSRGALGGVFFEALPKSACGNVGLHAPNETSPLLMSLGFRPPQRTVKVLSCAVKISAPSRPSRAFTTPRAFKTPRAYAREQGPYLGALDYSHTRKDLPANALGRYLLLASPSGKRLSGSGMPDTRLCTSPRPRPGLVKRDNMTRSTRVPRPLHMASATQADDKQTSSSSKAASAPPSGPISACLAADLPVSQSGVAAPYSLPPDLSSPSAVRWRIHPML